MNIEHLMWNDITITHFDSKGRIHSKFKTDIIKCGSIRFGVREGLTHVSLSLQGYDSVQGFSNTQLGVYVDPELVKLTPNEVEFKAKWWGVTFQYKDKRNPKKITGEIRKEHPVKITAKF